MPQGDAKEEEEEDDYDDDDYDGDENDDLMIMGFDDDYVIEIICQQEKHRKMWIVIDEIFVMMDLR